jgi:integrase
MKYKHHQGYNVNDNPTMEEYMILWYNTNKRDEGAIETQNMYRNCINVHINPVLGKHKVKEITATQVKNLLKEITSSKSLAHKVRITLNQIFKQAIADRLISFNPVQDSKVIAPDKPVRKCLSPVQRELMLHILKDSNIYPLMFTILYTGMRLTEALALLWKDIDFENGIIKVTKGTEFDHAKPKQKATKTPKGNRDIPIPEVLSKYLKQYQKPAKNKTKKSLYVFPGHNGGLMGKTELKRTYRKAKEKVHEWFEDKENEKMAEHSFDFRFRLLRHTYCTGLYDAGIDEISAAEIMGHDIDIMREVYTHISDTRKKKTVTKLETLYQESNVIEMKESK